MSTHARMSRTAGFSLSVLVSMNAHCLASERAARISASSRSSARRLVGSIVSSDFADHRSTNAAASATAASSRSFIASSLGASGVRSQRTPCAPDSTAVVTRRAYRADGGGKHELKCVPERRRLYRVLL